MSATSVVPGRARLPSNSGLSLACSFLLRFIFFLLATSARGQTPVNGQIHTNGLIIIDAPAIGNPGHAGSNINIAVDVSGNGRMSSDASNPNSSLPTHIDSVDIYLVSSETKLNLTVSNSTGFLMGEAGSTVKHLNWPIPTCISAGQYNLTFYERFQFNGESHYTITPISIPIDNSQSSGAACTEGTNNLEDQPQPSTPLSSPPWLNAASSTASGELTLTLTISDGTFDFPTITRTVTPTGVMTSTVVLVSMETFTTTIDGSASVYTETFTSTATVTANADNSGFVPVNAELSMKPPNFTFLSILLGLLVGALNVSLP